MSLLDKVYSLMLIMITMGLIIVMVVAERDSYDDNYKHIHTPRELFRLSLDIHSNFQIFLLTLICI
jgi:hypothetical protein